MKNITEANLVYLIEECGEVVKAASQVLRFGSIEDSPSTHITHGQALKYSLCRLIGIIELFEIDEEEMDAIIENKYDDIDQYLPLEIINNEDTI